MDTNNVTYKWMVGGLVSLLLGFGGLYIHSTDARITNLEAKQDVDSGQIPAMREEIKAMRESLARVESLLRERR